MLQEALTDQSLTIPILENTAFEEFRSESHRIPHVVRLSKMPINHCKGIP